METCGFRDILFATKLPQAITLVERQILLRSNITRHKANKTAECPLEHSAEGRLFGCHKVRTSALRRAALSSSKKEKKDIHSGL